MGGDSVTKEEKLLFGERLRKQRIAKRLTQEETADRLHISLRYYQMLERGENVGSVELLLSLSSLLECSLDYLLRGRLQENESALAARFNRLSAAQRAYAEKLLALWLESLEISVHDACRQNELHPQKAVRARHVRG